MNNYQDLYSRYHDKPVTEVRTIPSNNGWIYTSYSVKVGLPVNMDKLQDCFNKCIIKGRFALRTPNKITPPQSRDEILGAISLGILKPNLLPGWNFSPYPIPEFNLLKLIKQLYDISPNIDVNSRWTHDWKHRFSVTFKHRNYFWQNNLDQIYRFAFSVPLQDRYFILKTWNTYKWYKPSHFLYRVISFIDEHLGSPSGIKFLKYGGEKNKMEMIKEFPVDHPIRLKVLNEI